MKIAIFDAAQHSESAFDELRPEHQVTVLEGPIEPGTLARLRDTEILSGFVHSPLDRKVLAALPALRLIATQSTGFDHIDLDFCRDRGIAIANVPNYGERTIAEHTFALLLAISRALADATARTRAGDFRSDGLLGFDLAERVLGVIGTGNIGRNVIRIAKGFGMRVLAHDIAPDPDLAAAVGFEYVPLEVLFARSDVISLHVPATPSTTNLLSVRAFEAMKEGVVVINTARGAVIDARALIRALRSGKVAAAGLDVLPEETLFRNEADALVDGTLTPERLGALAADHVLCAMPNVVVTPHSAFLTREAIARIAAETVENIRSFARGQPRNIVGAAAYARTA